MNRQIDVKWVVVDARHELEVEGQRVALPNGNPHRKPDREVVGDIRRLAIGVRDEWQYEPDVSAERVRRGGG